MCLANPIYNAGRQDENFGFEQLDWEDAIENKNEKIEHPPKKKKVEVEKA